MFPTKVLLVTDGSKQASRAAEAAVDLTNGTGSELHVVHIVSTAPEMPYPHPLAKERSEVLLEAKKLHGLTLLDKRVGWLEKIGGRVKASHYREGAPDEQVIRLGQELDIGLVIVAGRKLNWFERTFADNLSERLVRRANRPVMVVREPVERKSKAPDRQ